MVNHVANGSCARCFLSCSFCFSRCPVGFKSGFARLRHRDLVSDVKIAWPVLFDASRKNNANFGVQGIPQLVVIDRKGIVRKVEVGFTPESFAKTAELVQSLVK